MTEEKPDIKETKKRITPRIVGIKIIKSIALLVLSFVLSLSIGLNYFYIPPETDRSGSSCDIERDIEASLLLSLQSAAAIYVAQQRIAPEIFSDFVVDKGQATGVYTLTLQDFKATTEFIDTKNMQLTFNTGEYALYYLNGTDVTAFYSSDILSEEEKQRKIIEEQEKQIKEEQTKKDNLNLLLKIIPITIVCFVFFSLFFN